MLRSHLLRSNWRAPTYAGLAETVMNPTAPKKSYYKAGRAEADSPLANGKGRSYTRKFLWQPSDEFEKVYDIRTGIP